MRFAFFNRFVKFVRFVLLAIVCARVCVAFAVAVFVAFTLAFVVTVFPVCAKATVGPTIERTTNAAKTAEKSFLLTIFYLEYLLLVFV